MAECAKGVYRQRRPRESAFYRLVEEHYEQFEQAYPERYEDRYGFLRPVIRETVYKYLACGDLKQGFARVRCRDCGHEYLLAYSCKRRYFCTSCHTKRAVAFAEWLHCLYNSRGGRSDARCRGGRPGRSRAMVKRRFEGALGSASSRSSGRRCSTKRRSSRVSAPMIAPGLGGATAGRCPARARHGVDALREAGIAGDYRREPPLRDPQHVGEGCVRQREGRRAGTSAGMFVTIAAHPVPGALLVILSRLNRDFVFRQHDNSRENLAITATGDSRPGVHGVVSPPALR